MKKLGRKLISHVIVMSVLMVMALSGCDSSDYSKAQDLLDSGSYDSAISAFEQLGDYKDSAEKVKEAKYKKAVECLEKENSEEAKQLFEELGDYEDSVKRLEDIAHSEEEKANEEKYQNAIEKLSRGNFEDAKILFEELGDYKDSAERIFCTLQLDDTYTFNGISWKVIDAYGDNYILICDTETMSRNYQDFELSSWYKNCGDSYLDSFSNDFRNSVVYSHKGRRDSALFGTNYYMDYQPGGHHKQDEDDRKVVAVVKTNYSSDPVPVTQHYNFAENNAGLSRCHVAMWVDRTSLM